MKRLLGVIIILIAVAGGIYIGGWLFFIKAIVGIIEGIKAGWIAFDIAINISKIIIGIPAVGYAACFLAYTGLLMTRRND